jgi:hypothetical protein
MPNPHSDDDPPAAFELPPDLMTSTFEHAISDDADSAHEHGHAIAAALQKALKGSTVEFGFPGIVTAHLKSGAIARCGGPSIGWMIDLQRSKGADVRTIEVNVPEDATDATEVAEILAKALKRF